MGATTKRQRPSAPHLSEEMEPNVRHLAHLVHVDGNRCCHLHPVLPLDRSCWNCRWAHRTHRCPRDHAQYMVGTQTSEATRLASGPRCPFPAETVLAAPRDIAFVRTTSQYRPNFLPAS